MGGGELFGGWAACFVFIFGERFGGGRWVGKLGGGARFIGRVCFRRGWA